jgi:hypothetical protein
MSRVAIAALLTALACMRVAFADSWPGPTLKAAMSESGDFIVRVAPGTSIGDTYGFASAPKGKFATAQWLRFREGRYEPFQSTTLLNPVAPLQIAVANDGTLVTLDNWHNVGYGEVVVIYGPDGKVRRKYGLRDLYASSDVVDRIDRSVSSIWWRCVRTDLSPPRGNVMQIDDTQGGRFTFQLTTGEYTYERGVGECRKMST